MSFLVLFLIMVMCLIEENFMTIIDVFEEYFDGMVDFTEAQKEIMIEVYFNSSAKQRERILDEMYKVSSGEDWRGASEFEDYMCEYANMGSYPFEYFVWLHMRNDLMCETEFRELEEWIEETEGKDALEEKRKSPKWSAEVYPDGCVNSYDIAGEW